MFSIFGGGAKTEPTENHALAPASTKPAKEVKLVVPETSGHNRNPSSSTFKSLKRTATVNAGIKAEQERSDILKEQIQILSEKAAQAFDKVAEVEAENQRLLEKLKNVETLLQEKNTLSKRKTTNQELLDLKIQNNNLSDKIYSQNIETTRLKKENVSLKTVNSDLVNKTNSLEKVNKELTIKNNSLQKLNNEYQHQCDKLQQQVEDLRSSNSTVSGEKSLVMQHERDNSISSISSKDSTIFSFTRNSSTDDVNKLALSPISGSTNTHDIIAELNKKATAYKKEVDSLQEKLSLETQKKFAVLNNFKNYQEKTALLSDFNSNYIAQLNEKIDHYKRNETIMRSKMDLIQTNMNIIQSNKPMFS